MDLQTERNLTVSAAIFQEMLDELLEEKKKVDEFASELRLSQYRIDSISAEKDLYLFPSDSLQTRQYAFLLIEIAKELKPVEDSLTKYTGKLDSVQTSLNEIVFELNTEIESLELIRRSLNASIFEKEIPDDQGAKFYQRPLSEAISYSYTKEKLALIFYLKLYQTRLLIMAFLIFITWIFIRTLKNRVGLLNEQDIHEDGKVILIHPLLSSIVIVIGCFQFFFPSPPFIFYWLSWFLASIAITLIFSNFLKSFWFLFWLFTVLIFLLSGITNMILLPTAEERILLIGLSLIGILFLTSTFIKNKTDQLKENHLFYLFHGIF